MKKNFGLIAYYVFFIMISFAALEIGLAMMLKHHNFADRIGLSKIARSMHIYSINEIQATDCARFDKDLFYTLAPGACKFDSDALSSSFSTYLNINSLGTRDYESSLRKPTVICIGDSHTMGWGVNQGHDFPKIVETISTKKTLNAGISSYGTARELILLSKSDTSSMTDLVIQYCSNDLSENKAFVENSGKLKISPPVEFYTMRMINKERVDYFPGRLTLLFAKALQSFLASSGPRPAVDPAIPDQVSYFLKALALSPVDLSKTRIHVIAFMDNPEDERSFRRALLEETAKSGIEALRNINAIDISDLYAPRYIIPNDSHLNALGHSMLGERIAHALRR